MIAVYILLSVVIVLLGVLIYFAVRISRMQSDIDDIGEFAYSTYNNCNNIMGIVSLIRRGILVNALVDAEEKEMYEECVMIKKEIENIDTVLKQLSNAQS